LSEEELLVGYYSLELIDNVAGFGKAAVSTGSGKPIGRVERMVKVKLDGAEAKKGVQVMDLTKKLTLWDGDEADGKQTIVGVMVQSKLRQIDWKMPP